VEGICALLTRGALSRALHSDALGAKVGKLASRYGLDGFGAEPTGWSADHSGEVLGYYSDPNGLPWCGYVDGEHDAFYVAATIADR